MKHVWVKNFLASLFLGLLGVQSVFATEPMSPIQEVLEDPSEYLEQAKAENLEIQKFLDSYSLQSLTGIREKTLCERTNPAGLYDCSNIYLTVELLKPGTPDTIISFRIDSINGDVSVNLAFDEVQQTLLTLENNVLVKAFLNLYTVQSASVDFKGTVRVLYEEKTPYTNECAGACLEISRMEQDQYDYRLRIPYDSPLSTPEIEKIKTFKTFHAFAAKNEYNDSFYILRCERIPEEKIIKVCDPEITSVTSREHCAFDTYSSWVSAHEPYLFMFDRHKVAGLNRGTFRFLDEAKEETVFGWLMGIDYIKQYKTQNPEGTLFVGYPWEQAVYDETTVHLKPSAESRGSRKGSYSLTINCKDSVSPIMETIDEGEIERRGNFYDPVVTGIFIVLALVSVLLGIVLYPRFLMGWHFIVAVIVMYAAFAVNNRSMNFVLILYAAALAAFITPVSVIVSAIARKSERVQNVQEVFYRLKPWVLAGALWIIYSILLAPILSFLAIYRWTSPIVAHTALLIIAEGILLVIAFLALRFAYKQAMRFPPREGIVRRGDYIYLGIYGLVAFFMVFGTFGSYFLSGRASPWFFWAILAFVCGVGAVFVLYIARKVRMKAKGAFVSIEAMPIDSSMYTRKKGNFFAWFICIVSALIVSPIVVYGTLFLASILGFMRERDRKADVIPILHAVVGAIAIVHVCVSFFAGRRWKKNARAQTPTKTRVKIACVSGIVGLLSLLMMWAFLVSILAYPSSSFVGETKVLTPDGRVSVEDLSEGDAVISYDPALRATVVSHVEKTSTRFVNDYYILNDLLKVTGRHPFAVKNESGGLDFRVAEELSNGIALKGPRDEDVTVYRMQKVVSKGKILVYNIQTSFPHTYFVLMGETPVLVHNKSIGRGL